MQTERENSCAIHGTALETGLLEVLVCDLHRSKERKTQLTSHVMVAGFLRETRGAFGGLFLFLFGIGSHYLAQAGLELMILLPQPPKCWDGRHTPPHLVTS
jgi:hypothetical protein